MKEKKISEKDKKMLQRFYGDKWKDHIDELMKEFAWDSDAYRQARMERLRRLPAEERLCRCIFGFEDEPEWEPDIDKAEEIIQFPIELAKLGEAEFEKLCKFVKVLRGIIKDDGSVRSNYHLSKEYVTTESERDKEMWVIRGQSRDGEKYCSIYPTLGRALANFLIDCPFESEEWLDYAAMFMYDGANGQNLRKVNKEEE